MATTIAQVFLNFLAVLGGLVVFILPFYLLHVRERQRRGIRAVPFNSDLEQFFSGRYANYLIFFWAAGEATVWFMLPEFLLVLLIFMRVHKKFQLITYDIYGTVAGTALALAFHLNHAAIAELPYIQPKMVDQVTTWYDQHGIFGLIFQPFSGVPFKVFNFVAADYHFFIPAFIAFAVLVRIARYYIMYALLGSFYPVLHRYVRRNYVPLFIIATLIFSLLLLRVSSLYA